MAIYTSRPSAGAHSRSHRRFGHVMTRVRAALAGIGAQAHLLIIRISLTCQPALLTDLCADRAGVRMQIGSAEHEIGAGLADFRAVQQQPDMRRLAHLPALRKTMCDRQRADALAVAAILDALLHVVGCHLMAHKASSEARAA